MDQLSAVRTFIRVADLGSFAGAARDMGISTSSVSRLVGDLEDHLGVRLLSRTTRRIGLTEAGSAYRDEARGIIDAFDALTERAHEHASNPSGKLRVTTTVALGESWVVPLLPSFHHAYPDVFVELDISDRMTDLVAEGYDLGVRTGPLRDSSMIARRMMSIDYIICASPAYIARCGEPETPDDLDDHACIVYNQANREGEVWWFQRQGKTTTKEVRGIMSINNAWGTRDVMMAGIGIGFVPDFVVRRDVEAGRLVRLMTKWDASADEVHAVYPSKQHIPAKLRVFVDHLAANRHIRPEYQFDGLYPT